MLVVALLAAAGMCTPRPRRTVGECRTVGVDFGLARVGVAISSGFAPLPLTVLSCSGSTTKDFEQVATAVATVAAGEGATQIVLGMPYNSDGEEGDQANITRAFATVLADAVAPRPVFLWDERFSSAEAQTRMNGGRGATRGQALDAVAAAVILEDFFAAEDDVARAAPYVPAKRIVAPPARPKEPRPVPMGQAAIRRAMMARVAKQQAESASRNAVKSQQPPHRKAGG